MECNHNFKRCFLPEMYDSFRWCILSEINYSMNFNFSMMEVFKILQEHQIHDENVNHTTEMILIFVYAFMMISGLSANLIISFVAAQKSQMHSPRNLYIVNLTASDMTLCVICMPFTLISIVQRHWDLGPALCKLVPTVQGTNILVSVGTISVIAMDRYFTIVCRQEVQNTRKRVVSSIAALWILSALASTPVFYYQTLVPVKFHNMILYEMCVEQWPSQKLKVFYTTSVLLVQAVIPVMVVGVVHTRIASHLRSHARTEHDQTRMNRKIERNRRTTLLLSIVAILFALSWLPLGVFSLLADVLYPADVSTKVSPQNLYVAFAICHVIAMSSAITNPVVYGWLNSNIRKEFLQLIQSKCSPHPEEGVPKPAPAAVTRSALSVTTQTMTEAKPSSSQAVPVVYQNEPNPPREISLSLDTAV
ncbi:hypothetical protein J6590_035746 [Homalodisca vitripennis]|nr:hypothetical protein J6590_035746 [Homalodisca vitripennis]